MRLRMKTTRLGSPNGLSVFSYQAGQEYSDTSTPRLSDELAAVFLAAGAAEEVAEKPFRKSASVAPVAPAPVDTSAAAPTPAASQKPEASAAAAVVPAPQADTPMAADAASTPPTQVDAAAPASKKASTGEG